MPSLGTFSGKVSDFSNTYQVFVWLLFSIETLFLLNFVSCLLGIILEQQFIAFAILV